MITIEITTPDGVHVYPIQAERVSIGRLGSNDIVLPYAHISRRHAELRWFNGSWWIADLHSTNGLHASGQRIQETALEPGGVIALSPHVTLRLLDATPAAAPQPESTRPEPPTPPVEASYESPPPLPLATLGPRSPYAEDESPYYPRMRPQPAASRPRDSQPRATPPPHARLTPPPNTPHPSQPGAAFEPRSTPTAPMLSPDAAAALRRRPAPSGDSATTLHICHTCGQLTAPDVVYCQNCHHSIATECPNCRLSLLPIQATCPRCQTPNPGAVRRSRRTSK